MLRPTADQLHALKTLTNEDVVHIVAEDQPLKVVQVDSFNRCLLVATESGEKTVPVTDLQIEGKYISVHICMYVYRSMWCYV